MLLPANNEEDVPLEECTDDINRSCEQIEGCTGILPLRYPSLRIMEQCLK